VEYGKYRRHHGEKIGRKIRVAFITNRVPNYRFPIFKMLQDMEQMDLRIIVTQPVSMSSREAQRELKLYYSPGININVRTMHRSRNVEQHESAPFPLRLCIDLFKHRPDIVISGDYGLRSLCSLLTARMLQIPFVLWTEETEETAASIRRVQRWLRALLIPRTDRFLAWGKPARKYLKAWNVADNKIYLCAQAVDNAYWQRQARKYDKEQLRQEFNVVGKVFLSVGQLVARKGVDLLLTAWAAMDAETQRNNTILIVGSGEQEQLLRTLALKNGLSTVHFLGFKEMEELPKYYAVADVFVFPSLVDVWGLVVNEAMASGLPVLVSRYSGVGQGLVAQSGCGELIDPMNSKHFSKVLKRWCLIDVETNDNRCQEAVRSVDFCASVNAIVKLTSDLLPVAKHNH